MGFQIKKNARAARNQDEYKKREAELAQEYDREDTTTKAMEAEIQKRQSCDWRMEGLIAALEETGEDITMSLWESMARKITAFEEKMVSR